MRLFFLICVLWMSVNAHASYERFHYYFSGFSGGNYSMVTCEYAEYRLRDILNIFGATEIATNCSGGIDFMGNTFPLSLSASYKLQQVTESSPFRFVEYRSDPFTPACNFNTGMVRQLLRQMPQVEVVNSFTACFRPGDSFSYLFKVYYVD